MSTNTALAPIKTKFHEEVAFYADTLTKRNALNWAVIGLSAVVVLLGLQNRQLSKAALDRAPLVIRVDGVGRADAVNYRINSYTPHDQEMRYFLGQFIVGFYSRNHRLTARDYPASLAFLSPKRLAIAEEENRKTQWYGKFMTSADDDIDVNVKNIGLDLSSKPYRAHVDYEKIFTTSGGTETKRESWTCDLAFLEDDHLAENKPEYVRYNPLGFQITDYRAEPAM